MKDDLIKKLLQEAPPLIKERYPETRVCVFASRVAIEVLHYFGIQAQPWSWRLVAMNAIAADAYAQGRRMSDTWDDGGFALGQDGSGAILDPRGYRWDGHLTAMVPRFCVVDGEEGALLVDLSLGDLNRPDKAIHTAPLGATVPQRLIDERLRVHIPLPEGGIAMYEPLVSDVWRQAPDWRVQARWKPLVGELIRALR